jgi:ubiquinone/menaquinone biosynthesis C-methylase UbiE
MSDPFDPRQEFASTHVIQDLSNQEEMGRLLVQDRMFTAGMGGVLAEQPEPNSFRRVLDVGCGPGGWVIETAQAYPDISLLIGIDVNGKMLESAREQASTQKLGERVAFYKMDALRMLEFPDAYFDLVNLRTGMSWLRKWDWLKLLQEFWRVLRVGGMVRLTEINGPLLSNSAAMTSLWSVVAQSFLYSGTYFAPNGEGFDSELVRLLEQCGLQQVQTREYTLEYRPDTPEGQLFIEDARRLYRTIKPFLHRWTRVPDDYGELYQQMLKDIEQPEFVATAKLFTVWGRV